MKCSRCKNAIDCSQCGSIKLVYVSAKCENKCHTHWWEGKTGRTTIQNGYLPTILGIGDNREYLEFTFCVDCGQIQDYKSDV